MQVTGPDLGGQHFTLMSKIEGQRIRQPRLLQRRWEDFPEDGAFGLGLQNPEVVHETGVRANLTAGPAEPLLLTPPPLTKGQGWRSTSCCL